MKVVCISDTHLTEPDTPKGDLLVHAGDMTFSGDEYEITCVNDWFGKIKKLYKHGIVAIPGNHDFMFEQDQKTARGLLSNATVLIGEELTIEGKRIYGFPWVNRFYDWAFMLNPAVMSNKVQQIPEGLDMLITHGPPMWTLDKLPRGDHVGSKEMTEYLKTLIRPPRFYICGHIHCGYGIYHDDKTTYINAAICNGDYSPDNAPFVINV